MDLPEIPPFRKKDSLPCNNNHGSTAPSSTTTPPSTSNNNNHDIVGIADHNSVAPLSTTAPLPFHCNDEIFDVVPLEAPQTQLDIPHQTEDTMEEEPSLFVPSMGAWSKPLVLKFPSPCTPPEPSTPCNYDPHLVQSQIEKFWPSLDESTNFKKKKSSLKVPSSPNLPVTQLPPPDLKEDGSLCFPWAARMNPATRNLYRASRPTFRLDGTPEIIIPTKVLQLGPENVGEYVIGQFHRCSAPSGGLTHAVVNRLWVEAAKLHVDDCLMFVAPWNPKGSLKIPEISTVPAWVTLQNIPTSCYSRLGISHIASGLGEPMLTHKPRLDPLNIGEAKILVEIELDKSFPKQIALDDKLGNIFLVDVIYSWIPSTCGRCGSLGHKAKRCLLKEDKIPPTDEKRSEHKDLNIPVVDIDSLLDNTNSDVQQNQHVPFEFGKPVASSTDISSSPATTEFTSPQVANSHKDSPATHGNSLPNAKCTLSSTLAGTSSAHTSLQVMDDAPSEIIMDEDTILSASDPLKMTPLSTESIQDVSNMESDFLITEQMDEVGSMTRGVRLIKPTQKYQDMGWMTVRGKGKRDRRGQGSYQAH
ncbi:hypothetical protein F2Q69_00061804 [Brassica cretica]|uniref:CCHC-type domain-containing protein n=1 Tax=Brassica cretica TaxID=69181 RepID=A0A8S9RJR8_BRACR|nr:hypothetical protein F2Q69_00061804 [Brassica cretica]